MLVVDGLTKRYPGFDLDGVSFEIEPGYITGFIGVNGAGKTTTLKSILNIVRPDAGTVTFEGRDIYADEARAKQLIGAALGPLDVYPKHRVRTVVDVYRRFHDHWDGRLFARYLERFGIDDTKKVSELSTGMRVKLGVAMALSHGARLVLLDEPTSGLDPVARDQLLGVLQEVVEEGERAVLFSTHITSDLDKIADLIVFIREGRIIADDTKDDLIDGHRLVGGARDELTDDLRGRLIVHRDHAFGFSGLVRTADLDEVSPELQAERPNLEDLMVFYDLEGAR